MLTTKMRVRQIREIEIEGLGQRIRKARMGSPKPLEQLCEEVGVSRTYWYDIEKETLKGALSIENLRKIEKVLETDFGVSLEHNNESSSQEQTWIATWRRGRVEISGSDQSGYLWDIFKGTGLNEIVIKYGTADTKEEAFKKCSIATKQKLDFETQN